MKAQDLYNDIADFRQYCEGMSANTTIAEMMPSIRVSVAEVISTITQTVFNEVATSDDVDGQLSQLKTAVANRAMYHYQIFSSVGKNGSDAKLYKYQHEEIKDHYVESYWHAMDTLLSWLDSDAGPDVWKKCDKYTLRQLLPVRSASEFDYYFGIDSSSYFFSKIQYLLRMVWLQRIKPAIGSTELAGDFGDLVKRCLCYQTMAEAVIKFDVTELPRSIRYDYNHEYSKDSSMRDRDKLYSDLMGDVSSWMDSISNIVKASSGATSIDSDNNEEPNKFYLI